MLKAVDSETTEVVAVDGFVSAASSITVAVRTNLLEELTAAAVASAVAATEAVVKLALMIVVASGVAEDFGTDSAVVNAERTVLAGFSAIGYCCAIPVAAETETPARTMPFVETNLYSQMKQCSGVSF